jgi:hypothetical protein
LTAISGGAAPAQAGQAFTQHRREARVWVEAWPYLLGLALLLFLPDVAIRRLQLRGRLWQGFPGERKDRPAGTDGQPMDRHEQSSGQVAARFGTRGRRG